MKLPILALAALAALLCPLVACAQNSSSLSPITMEQLMQDLRIQGGNFVFTFDQPVYARVTTSVSQYPDGKKTEIERFDTENPQQKIDLLFTAQPMEPGRMPRGDQENPKQMKINLSGCPQTEGTRLVYYREKFVENRFRKPQAKLACLRPEVPAAPLLDKEYVLHWYYQEGDPYQAKATLQFSAKPFPKE
jgi:hypothetical protein